MATKKIALNELRSLVKKVIKEVNGNSSIPGATQHTIPAQQPTQQPAQQTRNKQMGGADVTKFGKEINMVIASYFNQGFLPTSILEALKGNVQNLENKIAARAKVGI